MIIENIPTCCLTFNIFSAFAEFERDMIVTRTQEGKMYARMHNPNFKEGRPKKQLSTSFSHSEHNESSC